MERFKQFLATESEDYLFEAKVSPRQANRAVSLVAKVVSKRIGEKLYRYGGRDGVQEYGRGVGFLFMAPSGKAFRLNLEGGEFKTASIWKSFKLGAYADFTVTFEGLNIVEVVDKLADIVKSPRAETIEVDLEESVFYPDATLLEARRVSPEEFHTIVMDALQPGEDPEKLRMDRIKQIALAADVNIPGFVRKNRTSRGKFSVIPNMNNMQKSSAPGGRQYYIKVTPQDTVTKKFLSAKDDQYALDLTKKIQDEVNKPSMNTVKKEMKNPDTLFGHMKSLVKIVARGARASLIIYGGAGIGKTFVTTEAIKEEGLTKNKDYFVIKGKITNASLYQTLFMHRDGKLLVFDDADSVWDNAEAANILKAALDSYDERTISWSSTRTVNVALLSKDEREKMNREIDEKLKTDPENAKIKYPSEFIYKGKIIFISNLPYEKFDKAVLSRSAKINMELTQEQVFERIKSIIEFVGDRDVPVDAKLEVLEYLKERHILGLHVGTINFRTFVAAVDVYKSEIPNWKELIDYV